MMCFCAEYCIRKNGAAEFKRSRQLFGGLHFTLTELFAIIYTVYTYTG